MMGSAMLPAVIVLSFVFLCPESPRWYMGKGRHAKAYQSMVRLRYSKVQAARDVFYMHTLLDAESSMTLGHSKMVELVSVPRNRRALIASEIVMFMQQVSRSRHPKILTLTDLVLWRQRHRLLLLRDLRTGRIHRIVGPFGILWIRHHQLSLRDPGNLHDRHLRSTEPAPDNLSTDGAFPVLHRVQLLDP